MTGMLIIGAMLAVAVGFVMWLEARDASDAEICCEFCGHAFAPDDARYLRDYGAELKIFICHACYTGQGA